MPLSPCCVLAMEQDEKATDDPNACWMQSIDFPVWDGTQWNVRYTFSRINGEIEMDSQTIVSFYKEFLEFDFLGVYHTFIHNNINDSSSDHVTLKNDILSMRVSTATDISNKDWIQFEKTEGGVGFGYVTSVGAYGKELDWEFKCNIKIIEIDPYLEELKEFTAEMTSSTWEISQHYCELIWKHKDGDTLNESFLKFGKALLMAKQG